MGKSSKYSTDNVQNEDLAFKQSAWASARQRKGLDSETLVYLRANLQEPFGKAENWPNLRELLRGKGFDMKPRAGRLRLVDLHSQVEICTFGTLGHPRAELEQKFGAMPQLH